MARLTRITEPFVLLCEGLHDSQFFTHLIRDQGLPEFEICSVNYVLGTSRGGNTRFTEALDELPALPGFESVRKILIVADNDLNPAGEFQRIQNEIAATAAILGPPTRRFVAPNAPLVKAGMNPDVTILMLPWTGTHGSLSTMCMTAAWAASPLIAACVDDLAACSGADQWPMTTLAKMKLRALIACSPIAKPELSPAYVWSQNTYLVPLRAPTFDQIRAFLRGFPNS